MEEQNTDRSVAGFQFGSAKDAELAKAEQDKINYIEKRMDYSTPSKVLAVYNRAIENRVFQTPVGFQYLQKILSYLEENGLAGEAKSIPLYQMYSYDLNAEVEKRTAKRRVEPSKYLVLRRQLRRSIWLNIILVLLVIALFVIMVTGKNPTIINYEQKIQNKYAAWEQQLDQREKEVRLKERDLGIESPVQPENEESP